VRTRRHTRVRPLSLVLTPLLLLLPLVVLAAQDIIRIDVIVNGFVAGQTFVSPRDVYCDTAHGEIYVADAGAHKVYIFDDKGWPVYQFTHWVTVSGERRPGEPSAVAVVPDGHIVLLDAMSRVVHLLDYRGRPLIDIDPARLLLAPGPDCRAVAVDVDAAGAIHVVAGGNGRYGVLILDQDGRLLRQVPLGAPGQLDHVTGFAVGADGSYAVTDLSAEYAVQIFDGGGRRIRMFGRHDVGMENFSYAADIAVARDGSLWVVDMIRQIVAKFDATGHFQTYLGGAGSGFGSMSYPCAVSLGRGGRVLVLEKSGRRFQSFVMPEGGGPGI